MESRAAERRRPIRISSYIYSFLFFTLILFLSHLWLMRLPYYWDEAGEFIPAALDILRGGSWIPHSATPTVHPPAVMAYLAAFWRVAGYDPAATRAAMLLLASGGLLAAFLLAIELSQEVRGAPAFLVAALLAASPLYFAQAMLAQLDAPAMLFTSLALWLFLQDRIRAAAAVCVVLVLVKETGLVTPLVFAIWLARERRWHEAAWFLAPAAALAVWMAVLYRATGQWLGNAEFLQYNLYYPWHAVRLTMALLRRLYYLFFADLHWVGTLAIVYAWRRSGIFLSRSWRIAWWLVAAHVVMLTVLGGAVLERYLLPVLPIVYTAMVAGLSLYRRVPQLVSTGVLLAGVAACNLVNPPYPFPYEDNLAFTDFVKLHADAADYLAHWYPAARVSTVWPLTAELARPELGYVSRAMAVGAVPNLAPATLERMDWSGVEVLVAYSRHWDPRFSLMHYAPLLKFRLRFYGYAPNATAAETRARVPFPIAAHFERHGQWADIYVNPGTPETPPARRTMQAAAGHD
ncbi:MAG: hypothetical protein LAP87_31215 [Acidobacteriia bacterium]|nr:hypothetical protein [Terriglobia bacterium]